MTKENKPTVDENFLKDLMAQDIIGSKNSGAERGMEPEPVNEEIQAEKPKEDNKRKKVKQPDYERCFLKESTAQARDGKSMNIRKEYHERINRIIHVACEEKITLFAYVDNVLAQHFETYQDEINELYKKNMNNLF